MNIQQSSVDYSTDPCVTWKPSGRSPILKYLFCTPYLIYLLRLWLHEKSNSIQSLYKLIKFLYVHVYVRERDCVYVCVCLYICAQVDLHLVSFPHISQTRKMSRNQEKKLDIKTNINIIIFTNVSCYRINMFYGMKLSWLLSW